MASNLTVNELRQKLSDLSLPSNGKRSDLQKRFRRAHHKPTGPSRAACGKVEDGKLDNVSQEQWQPKYHKYLVLDFEATCEDGAPGGPFNYPNESESNMQRTTFDVSLMMLALPQKSSSSLYSC